jgi:plasmid stabilization system protein ParE
MVFRVNLTAAAKQDARKILVWLRSQQSGETGLRWFRGMQKAIESLNELPFRCALSPEARDFPFEVRQLLYGSTHHRYRILFTIRDDKVTVLHVRHGRRDSITH